MTDIYENSADNSARFVLGTVGDNPLVCVGGTPALRFLESPTAPSVW